MPVPKLNIDPGLSADIATEDEVGNPWDFSKESMWAKALLRVR